MKNFKNKLIYALIVALLAVNSSCNEEGFLEEVPLDFYSVDNSYQTMANFQSALTDLYARVRNIHYGETDNIRYFAHFMATDLAKHARGDANRFGDYDVWLVPTNDMVSFHWNSWYKVIEIGRAHV